MIRRVSAAFLAAASCAVLAVGCGGESSTANDASSAADSTAAATVTLAAFLKQADSICASARKETLAGFVAYLEEKGIKEIGGKGESPAQAEARKAEVIETLGIPSLREQQKAIRAIGLPQEKEDAAEAYLEASEASLAEAESNPVRLYDSAKELFAKSDKLAGQLGLEVCGNR